MPEFYTVSNSMQAKDRDGNPKVWDSQYGKFNVWNVYFEGDDEKYQVNKKQDFTGFTKGQQVYGTKVAGQYGGRFKQEQAPEGMQAPVSSTTPVAAGGADLGAKVDYLISLVENFLERYSGTFKSENHVDTVPTDIDDGPVDLSGVDY